MTEVIEFTNSQSARHSDGLGEGPGDRRQYPRVPVLESGLIYSSAGCVDCQVIDVSASGARVRPVEPIGPDDTHLRFLLARLGLFEAEIRWRSGDAIGLAFNATPETVSERCAPLLCADAHPA